MPPFVWPPCVAFLVSCIASWVLSRNGSRWVLLDVPNDRSLHAAVTPRSGGVGIVAGLIAGSLAGGVFLFLPSAAWVCGAFLLVAGVSFADDLTQLPPLLRLCTHAAAACLLVFPAHYLPASFALPGLDWYAPAWLLSGFSLLFIIWMVNLYNFMDGMDGFAGGMACIGFATLALMGWLAGSSDYCFAALLVCMASAGFLPFNFPPARLFMGDLGSGSLGLLVALFLLWAERAGLFRLWLGVLVFSPFIVDATWTVVRRTLRGHKPWEAHREHFYQRLVRLGWGHKRTVLWGYALMLKFSLLALVCYWLPAPRIQGTLLGLATLAYLALIVAINAIERRAASL